MRKEQRKLIKATIMDGLRAKEIDVQCGECAASHRAAWMSCTLGPGGTWLALSEVHCGCGCTLRSFAGSSVAMDAIEEAAEGRGYESSSMVRTGPIKVMSYVRAAVSAALTR